MRVYEVDDEGVPLSSVTTDRYQPGNGTRPEIQALYINGNPTSGTFTLTWDGDTTSPLAYSASAATIETALNGRSLLVTWSGSGAQVVIEASSSFIGGSYLINSDFFLRDDELTRLPTGVYTPPTGAADSVAGLIIRPRAQNTWTVR